jgi:hypothetical protein
MDGSNLALLDFKVTINENLPPTFEFYQKEAKKDIFINYKSGLLFFLKQMLSRMKGIESIKDAAQMKIKLNTTNGWI